MLITESLTDTLGLLRSLRNLRVKRANSQGGYSESTLQDAAAVLAYIRAKIGLVLGQEVEEAPYDEDFWYDLEINHGKYKQEPSHRCEVGSDKILQWFSRNQKFLKEPTQKDKIAPQDQDSDDEDEDEEGANTVDNDD